MGGERSPSRRARGQGLRRGRHSEGHDGEEGVSPALAIALAGIFTQILGFLVYGAARGPDMIQGPAAVLGTFWIACSVLCAQLSWGVVLGCVRRRVLPLWERYFWGASLTM